MSNSDISPIAVANVVNRATARKREELSRNSRARWEQGRRRDARSRGYRGPLTREEASRMALSAF